MKLATLRNGGRDGRLVVVSKDLRRCVSVADIAGTLQAALDRWDALTPRLRAVARALDEHQISGVEFKQSACAAPLPRAFQWADASAYLNHVELVRQARGAKLPKNLLHDPLMYQGGSDTLLGATDPIVCASESAGIDFEAELALITGDVPAGTDADSASSLIRLFMLVNDVSLRSLIPAELAKGFGFFQSKPSSAFSPVCVTPDELGDAWDGRKVHGELRITLNGELFGLVETGRDMNFSFPTLIAHAAKTRRLTAGTIIGSGTVSNRGEDGGPGRSVKQGGRGYSCIAEQRAVETIEHGSPRTPFMNFGDRIRIEMLDEHGSSIFGAIDQEVQPPRCGRAAQRVSEVE